MKKRTSAYLNGRREGRRGVVPEEDEEGAGGPTRRRRVVGVGRGGGAGGPTRRRRLVGGGPGGGAWSAAAEAAGRGRRRTRRRQGGATSEAAARPQARSLGRSVSGIGGTVRGKKKNVVANLRREAGVFSQKGPIDWVCPFDRHPSAVVTGLHGLHRCPGLHQIRSLI